jgi:transcriptional regulator with XRE-family HTH domain
MQDKNLDFDVRMIEAEENLVIDAQFLLQDLMVEHGITRADLARRAGISKARLTQLLKPDANPTLRNLARLFHALGETVHLQRKKATSALEHSSHEWMPVQEARRDNQAPARVQNEGVVVLLKSLYSQARPVSAVFKPSNDLRSPGPFREFEVAA